MEHELYDFSIIEIPKTENSVLYTLSPIKIDDSEVESLTSYISRLANAHNLRERILLEEFVKPHLGNLYSDGNVGIFRYGSYKLNGNGILAKETMKIMEHLTKQNNLSNLTFLSFSGLISNVKLLKQHKTWCPVCYHEMKIEGTPIYDKLIWNLLENKFCAKHNQWLNETCKKCNSKQIEIKPLSKIGYCQNCATWLGEEKKESIEEVPELSEVEKREILISELLYDLIAHRNSYGFSRENLSKSLSEIKKNYFEIPIAPFCRYKLGMNLNAYTSYINLEKVPELISLIRISLMFKVSLKNLLTNDLRIEETDTPILLPIKKKESKQLDQENARIYIESYLKEDQKEITPLYKMAEELNWSLMSLRKYFPDLCAKVKIKNQILQNESQLEERKARIKIIKQVVRELKKNGIKPTYRVLQKNLPFSFISADKELMDVWRSEVRRDDLTYKY